jgi:hypothetical protein
MQEVWTYIIVVVGIAAIINAGIEIYKINFKAIKSVDNKQEDSKEYKTKYYLLIILLVLFILSTERFSLF